MVEWLAARAHVPSERPALAASDVEVVLSDDDDDAPEIAAPASFDGWNHARPLGSTTLPSDGAVREQQLAVLNKARALRASIMESMPELANGGAAASGKGHVVHRESHGNVSISVQGHPHAVAEGHFDVQFVDTFTAHIVLRATGMGTGLLPLMSMIHEPDLVADYLPKPAGLPHIERLEFATNFSENDWVYRCFVSPFGPLPGADDLHGITFYDLIDEPEAALLFYAESPAEGTTEHRGWPVPPVKSWRRKRNYVLGATTLLRPSSVRPLELEPPTAAPGPCASPGCPYYAHSALSFGEGRFCCARCQDKPGKHAASCEQCTVRDGSGAPAWALASHGCVDLELSIVLKLPIPTFLIPLAFIRWVLIKLIKVVYPYLIALNERFNSTPFAQRVHEDSDGFYARLRATLKAPERPKRTCCDASGGARFVI